MQTIMHAMYECSLDLELNMTTYIHNIPYFNTKRCVYLN